MSRYDEVVAEITEEMVGDGYETQPPHPQSSSWIDREVCQEGKCSACGAPSPEYHPFTKYHPTGLHRCSYRAYAICRSCGHADEF